MIRNQSTSRYCSPKRWERIAKEHSNAASEDPRPVLSGCRQPRYTAIRWAAFRALRQAGFSYYTIADASGFDDTTIIYACNNDFRARKLAAKQALRRVSFNKRVA